MKLFSPENQCQINYRAVNLATMILQNVPLKKIWELLLIQISILILI